MKFEMSKECNNEIEKGSVITLMLPSEEEGIETIHLQVINSVTSCGDIAYHLLNMDEQFLIPILFDSIDEIEEFLSIGTEFDGNKIVRVTDSSDVKITLK